MSFLRKQGSKKSNIMTQQNQINKAELNNRFNQIVRNSLDVILKQSKYKKKGSKYLLQDEYFLHSIKIRKTRYNAEDELDFTIEFDLWMPKEIVLDLPFPFLAPILGVNLPVLCNNRMWLELKNNEESQLIRDTDLIEQIKEMLEREYLPFISNLKNLCDIIPLLYEDKAKKHRWDIPCTGGQTTKFLAIINYILGRKQEAIKIIENYPTKIPEFAETLTELKEQMQSNIPHPANVKYLTLMPKI